MTADVIAILGDEPDRVNAMEPVLRRIAADYAVVSFRNAPQIIEWLRDVMFL